METVAKRVKAAREHLATTLQRKVTQVELSTLCGWADAQSRLSNYERGIRNPDARDLVTIAKATGVRVEWLQFNSGHMHDDPINDSLDTAPYSTNHNNKHNRQRGNEVREDNIPGSIIVSLQEAELLAMFRRLSDEQQHYIRVSIRGLIGERATRKETA